VTGLDLSPVFLGRAVKIVKHSPLGAQISLLAGDRSRLPFADNSFDWVWSADCVGYPAGEGSALLTELSRVTRPGGQVAVLGWSSQQLLPGYSRREAYLNAHCARVAFFLEGTKPEDHFLRGLEWFRAAGLRDVSARTFIGQVTSPLESGIRRAMTALFGMLWGASLQSASPEDREAYQRLCSPGSPDFILDISQYYGFFTYSMFQGRVDGRDPGFFKPDSLISLPTPKRPSR